MKLVALISATGEISRNEFTCEGKDVSPTLTIDGHRRRPRVSC